MDAGSSLRERAHRQAGRLACSVVVLAASTVGTAQAQSVEEYLPAGGFSFTEPSAVPVLSRPRSEYDPLGVRAGAFVIRPRLDESVGYDDNPIGLTNKRGSTILNTAANLGVASNFSRNAVDLALGLINKQFFDLPQQSRTDYTVAAGTTIEIGRSKLTLRGSYLALHEDATEIDSQQLQFPVPYVAKQLQANYTTEYGQWQFEPNLSYLSYRFRNLVEPGQTFGEQVRDRDLYSAGFTVRYGFQQSRSILATARVVDTNYVGRLFGQARPDSLAYDALVGTDYALSGNLRFIALVGYEVRQFSTASPYKNISSPVLEASAVWTPTGLTTVTGKASRSIVDSIGESLVGVTYTRANLNVDHELRRKIILHGNAGIEFAEFATAGGQQTVYHAGAGVTYLINRNVRANLTYSFEDRLGSNTQAQAQTLTGTNTGSLNSGYTRNIFLLGLSTAL